MRGDTALTARLLKPVLLDGETGEVADSRALPVYLQALLISQPLHFGDYGGMPLKAIWAALDLLTIVVIGSGLYLWLTRRRKRAPAKSNAFARRAPVSS
ncbi:PepSY domain-containing protein [Bradyrhizobium sp. LM2.9]